MEPNSSARQFDIVDYPLMVYWMAQASRSGLMQEAIFVFLWIISWSTRNEGAGGKKDLPEVASILPVEAGNVPTLLCDILTASRWCLFIEVVRETSLRESLLRVDISPEDRRHCSQLGQLWYSTWRRAEPGRWRRDLNLLWIKKQKNLHVQGYCAQGRRVGSGCIRSGM